MGTRRTGVAPQLNSHSLLPSPSHLCAVTDIYGANNGLLTSHGALYDGEGAAFLLGATARIATHSLYVCVCVTQSPESAANALRVTRSAGSPTEHRSEEITGTVR